MQGAISCARQERQTDFSRENVPRESIFAGVREFLAIFFFSICTRTIFPSVATRRFVRSHFAEMKITMRVRASSARFCLLLVILVGLCTSATVHARSTGNVNDSTTSTGTNCDQVRKIFHSKNITFIPTVEDSPNSKWTSCTRCACYLHCLFYRNIVSFNTWHRKRSRYGVQRKVSFVIHMYIYLRANVL